MNLEALLAHFSYIVDVDVFTDLVFKHLILDYCSYSLIKLYNMDHTVSEYQLLWVDFTFIILPFLLRMHVQICVYVFSIEKQVLSLKMQWIYIINYQNI